MKKLVTNLSFGVIVTASLLAGCAEVAVVNPEQRHIVNEQLALPVTQGAAANFNSRIIFMADQLERNLDRKNLSNTVIVTSFANLNRLSETTSFGRLVAENLIHELQVRKWQVFEVRLTKDIIINESGEFSLSRDIKRLKDQYKIGGIVTGTYSVTGNNIIVNSRVIDINSGIVISSAQANLPVNWFTDNLLFSEENLKTMKIVGDTPYSCREIGTCSSGETAVPGKINGGMR
jgi:TolB-like protein